ncbi:hypothetical protein KI659_00085 [Litoribacter alkaliphilus]|uniref:DUF4145 domain-containing protein n=1 Tax=Litoribacter ruber TaxID=702568 RepID=A0AAP2CID6_9BACT|nr:MltR family transcriptional regulator [Litoribacter alkaliphilus]MBS9522402.1 hypothetical protein [Litoribacter alkaliphilus]
MCEDKKLDKEMFSGVGPLSSFSSKVKISYRLGLISSEEYKKIEIFRSIRNKFAHEVSINSLELDVFKDKIQQLVVKTELLPPTTIFLPEYSGQNIPPAEFEKIITESPRDIIEKFILYIANNLMGRAMEAINKRCKHPVEYKYSYEPLEIFLKVLKESNLKLRELSTKAIQNKKKILEEIEQLIEKNNEIIRDLMSSDVLSEENVEKLEKAKMIGIRLEKNKSKTIEEIKLHQEGDGNVDYSKINMLKGLTYHIIQEIKKAYKKNQ